MQFGFIPGRSTTDTIFIVRQLQEKFYVTNKTIHGLCRSGKGIRSCRRVTWLALRKLGVEEWLVRLIKSMYENTRCRVRVGCNLSEETSMKMGVHQGSFLPEPPTVHRGSGSPLPRVSYRMSLGKPVCRWPGHRHWIAGETTGEADPLEDQHGTKGTFGQQGQNQGSDGPRLGVLQRSDKDPCGVCLKGVGTNSIFVVVVPVAFAKDAVVCLVPWSLIPASGVNDIPKKPIDGRPVTEVTVGRKKIGVMPLRRHNVNCILCNGFSEISNKIYKYIVTQMQLKMSSANW